MADPNAYTQASGAIDSDTTQLMQQLAALRAQAAQQQQQYTQNLSGAGTQAIDAYRLGVDPVIHDLQAQGVDPSQFGQNTLAQQYGLLTTQNNTNDYIKALGAANTATTDAGSYAALQQAAAAHAQLAQAYAAAQIADDGSGGGGYGDGYGGYGSGGGDILTAGDASLEGDLAAEPYNDTPVTTDAQEQIGNKPLDTLLSDYLYGTHGQGDSVVKGGFGHVNFFGNNAASLASKYARYAKAKFGSDWTDSAGNKHKAVDKKTLKSFIQNLRSEQHKVQANHAKNHAEKVKQRKETTKAELRGLPVPEKKHGKKKH